VKEKLSTWTTEIWCV